MELCMSGEHVYVCFFRLCVFFTPEAFVLFMGPQLFALIVTCP
jgi:hypothetical protein